MNDPIILIVALSVCLFGTIIRLGFLNRRLEKLEKENELQ